MTTLTLHQLSKRYGDKVVLDGISAQLTPGLYGLLGANGTGKSTLLNLLCHFTKPDSGTIELDGKREASYFYEQVGFSAPALQLLRQLYRPGLSALHGNLKRHV